jgi:hypothetical protein
MAMKCLFLTFTVRYAGVVSMTGSDSGGASDRVISEDSEGRDSEPLPGAQESDVELPPSSVPANDADESSDTQHQEAEEAKPKPLIGDPKAGEKCCILL